MSHAQNAGTSPDFAMRGVIHQMESCSPVTWIRLLSSREDSRIARVPRRGVSPWEMHEDAHCGQSKLATKLPSDHSALCSLIYCFPQIIRLQFDGTSSSSKLRPVRFSICVRPAEMPSIATDGSDSYAVDAPNYTGASRVQTLGIPHTATPHDTPADDPTRERN